MRKIFVYVVLADLAIAGLVLYVQIKDFIWTHPWYHSFLVALPGIAVPVLAIFELLHSREANDLRAKQTKSLEKIGEAQAENIKLQADNARLQAERNEDLGKIAANTQRVPTEAENNAQILKKYLGQRAFVSEGGNNWGAMGAVVAEINDNNILTLFTPAGYSSSQASGQAVRCDKLHIVEVSVGSCPVQISIIERYGNPTNYGEAKSWDERNVKSGSAGMPRGQNVFHAQYRKEGSPKLRNIFIYAATDGSPNFTLVTSEDQLDTNSWYSSKLDIEKKFAVVQVEWADAKYFYNGGSGAGGLNLFFRK